MHQVLYRKWRPAKFSEVAGQDHVTVILKNQIRAVSFAHAYIFCGTRGSGKTTCARILARAVNCLAPEEGEPCGKCPACIDISTGANLDITEIDAASNNGVNDIRALRDESVFTPSSLKMRVYIIDEVHMLSTSAFNALLKVLEEPPPHILFILATTEIRKVPSTILSRCQRFDFRRIPLPAIQKRLEEVCLAEGFNVDGGALSIISRLADGALRNALSLLEQALGGNKALTAEQTLSALGLMGGSDLVNIARLILKNDLPALFSAAENIYQGGIEAAAFLDGLFVLMRDLLMIRALGQTAPLTGAGYDLDDISDLASGFPTDRLALSMRVIEECSERFSGGLSKRAVLELCLFRLCSVSDKNDTESLAMRISAIESRLAAGEKPMPSGRASSSGPVESAAVKLPVPVESPAQKIPEPLVPQKIPDPPEPGGPSLSRNSRDISQELVGALDGKIEVISLMHLKRSSAILSGDLLAISCPSDFDREQLSRRAVAEAIAAAAGGISGGNVRVSLSIAAEIPSPAPEAEKTDDRLDLLASLQNEFDDVVTIV